MSAASSLLSEEQFQCSICLDVFTDPVTIPCGHNFCKSCITKHWDIKVPCECPLCKDVFKKRPELRVNTFISEMACQVRQSTAKKTSSCSVQRSSSSGEVLCDVCSETKVKALKSCLMCLASYCETHLEPHHRIPGLKKHELMDPVENLEDRVCKNHDRPLEMFCRTDQMCVCHFCIESSHKTHVFVPMMEEYKVKKTKLVKSEANIQQRVRERRLKIEQIKHSVKLSREDADQEKSASVQVFTALIRSVEEGLAQLLDLIEEKQKETEEQAEGFIGELEEEISELMKRGAEVEQFLLTEDHLQFLQNLPSLSPDPPTKDWTEVRVHSSYEGTVRTAVAQLEETVSEEVKKQLQSEQKRVQQFAVDVTLDPETANPYLRVSGDKKQVYYGKRQNLPDNPERFSQNVCVFGKQSFSAGKFYFEVQVKEKTTWQLGVAQGLIHRKERITSSLQTGPWLIMLTNGNEYRPLPGSSVLLSLKSAPQKVGVFVDYEEGVISFYDVDTAAFIYSFTGCNFTGRLFPIFAPSDNTSDRGCISKLLTLLRGERREERGD
ncbi:E3 ubiquitin-protein ligase TRIM39-like isoform X2 [Notolabrus celidotus]|uniref:E3 ubiquitin-protein ligase TRIM39-like isoform X2 n=1 Tax=Notolabrus celidotus TaxID=1203425 RepID=UPI0014904CC5|nr:E3 ubiquitin-protein ligase TRIM39-like isoform X2 [Notolabrus celidotus]